MYTKLIRIFLMFGILYNVYWYYVKKDTFSKGIISEKVIVMKQCYKNTSSQFFVKAGGKNIRVEVLENKCKSYDVGDTIKLYFNARHNKYYIYGRKDSERLVFFFSIVFLLTFLKLDKLAPVFYDKNK